MSAYLLAGTAMAAPPPPDQASLNNCQNAVKLASAKFSKKKMQAVATCLQKISSDIIKLGGSNVSASTAKSCASQLRKIFDSRSIGRSLEEKKTVSIKKKCEPGMPLVVHTNGDIRGVGNTVPQPIDTMNIDAWCQNFGGDGSVDTVQEWIDCIDNSHECAADLAISVQYPRAIEWLGLLDTAISALPPPPTTDPNRYTDAQTALNTIKSTIDGTDINGVPSMACGKAAPPVCSTACCYAKFGAGPDTSCFEYTGTAAEVAAFTASCTGKMSSPFAVWTHAPAAGPCVAAPPPGPATGTPCAFGGPNFTLVPKDPLCP